jgi:hypothetical protein
MKKHLKTLVILSLAFPFFLGSCAKEKLELDAASLQISEGKINSHQKSDKFFPQGTSFVDDNYFILPKGYQFLSKSETGDFELSSSGYLQEGIILNMEDNKLMFEKAAELEGYEFLPSAYFEHPIFQQFFDDISYFLNQTQEDPAQLSGEKIWVPAAFYGQIVLVEIPKEYDTTSIYLKPLEKGEYSITSEYIVKTNTDFPKNFMEQK